MPRGSGKRRFRIDLIKQQDTASDTIGSTPEVFRVIGSRWADLRPMGSGHHVLSTRNIEGAATHKFDIRYEEQFDDRGKVDHIRFDGKMYEIDNVIDERERDRFLILECRLLAKELSKYNIKAKV